MRKDFEPSKEDVVQLDLNEFRDSPELLKPILDQRVFISLSTAKFEDLALWYRIRDFEGVEPNFTKPMFGKIVEFDTLDNFISGISSGYFPANMENGNDYAGIAVHGDNLVACNGSKLEVFSKDGRKEIRHPLFNDVKFVDFSADGTKVLVSCSGTDAILEFNYPEMTLNWSWFAPEHGYDKAPDGTMIYTQKMIGDGAQPQGKFRILDNGTDFGPLDIATKSQSTHVNSATYLDGGTDRIAATIFQYGHAVIIDKERGTTSLVKDGLSRPHGFYRFGGEKKQYVITSPTTGVVDILDRDYRNTHAIKGVIKTTLEDRTWLQNTFPISENILALVDHYNYHVVFFDIREKVKHVVETSKQWKIFQIALASNNHDSRVLAKK